MILTIRNPAQSQMMRLLCGGDVYTVAGDLGLLSGFRVFTVASVQPMQQPQFPDRTHNLQRLRLR